MYTVDDNYQYTIPTKNWTRKIDNDRHDCALQKKIFK